MANLDKVDESSLPESVRKRRRLIQQVKAVAEEIEFDDRGDRRILAKELDRRGVLPMAARKWFRGSSKSPIVTLERFLKEYIPELLRKRPVAAGKP